MNLTPSTEDIFAGGKELERVLEGQLGGDVLPDHSVTYQVHGPTGSAQSGKKLSLTHVMLGVLTIAVLGLMFRPAPKTVVALPPGYYQPVHPLGPNTVDQKQEDDAKDSAERKNLSRDLVSRFNVSFPKASRR